MPVDASDAVTCVACGRELPRVDAREYDKHGDRWERRGKDFEHLCKTCHEQLCHQNRAGLEDLLVDIGAGTHDDGEFLRRYVQAVEDGEEVE